MFESSLRVIVVCFDGRRVSGSGVAVSGRHVITARHVVKGCGGKPSQIVAVRHDGKSVELVVDATVDGSDAVRLVVVGSEDRFRLYASVRLSEPRLGESVCTVACDATLASALMKCGAVAASNDSQLVAAVHVVPGNSGGPVFDSQANVVGIWTTGRFDPRRDLLGVAVTSVAWKRLVP